MVAYSCAKEYCPLETEKGSSVWTQILAEKLKKSDKMIKDILEDVKNAMPANSTKEALPEVWDKYGVGKFRLQEGTGEFYGLQYSELTLTGPLNVPTPVYQATLNVL